MALVIESIILIGLLIMSGFFSGAEVALISLSKHKVQQMVNHKRAGALYVQKLKEDTHRMLATILIGNNIANVAASALATAVMLQVFDNYAISITTGVMTLLILVFGEITPKSIAESHNETVSRLVAGPIWYLSIILAPLLNVLEKFLHAVMNIFGLKVSDRTITEDEIISIVQTAEEEGSIKEIEKRMIHSIFEFDDIHVGEIATPRADMVAISAESTVKRVLDVMKKSSYSRIPVYEKNRDNIVGIIYMKDILNFSGIAKKNKVKKYMKKPYFVPEAKKIGSLLGQFQKRKEHLAMVVDEHGSVSGLITLEDVIEEIVGDIQDETDKEKPNIKKIGRSKWMVEGKRRKLMK